MASTQRKCSTCGKLITLELEQRSHAERYYPFCSKRCQLIDLGAWLDADYKIVSKPDADEPELSEQGF